MGFGLPYKLRQMLGEQQTAHQTMIHQTLRKETGWWQRQEVSVLDLQAHFLAARVIARASATNKLV